MESIDLGQLNVLSNHHCLLVGFSLTPFYRLIEYDFKKALGILSFRNLRRISRIRARNKYNRGIFLFFFFTFLLAYISCTGEFTVTFKYVLTT
jgi:hypothetical protein